MVAGGPQIRDIGGTKVVRYESIPGNAKPPWLSAGRAETKPRKAGLEAAGAGGGAGGGWNWEREKWVGEGGNPRRADEKQRKELGRMFLSRSLVPLLPSQPLLLSVSDSFPDLSACNLSPLLCQARVKTKDEIGAVAWCRGPKVTVYQRAHLLICEGATVPGW